MLPSACQGCGGIRVTGGQRRDVLLAFDFGLRRLGIATGNLATRTATALTTLDVGRDLPWTKIDAIVAEWEPQRLVVGMPETSAGPSAIRSNVQAFVASLAERYGLPVETVDETLTSVAASAELAEGRRSGLRRRRIGKASVDMHAARLILEQWMAETEDKDE